MACIPVLQEQKPVIEARFVAARQIQLARCGCINARLETAELNTHCELSTGDRKLLASASKKHVLSPRARYRILRVARTLADLDEAESIGTQHLAEAISYREISGRAAHIA